MRNKVRIENFLNKVNINHLINDIWKLTDIDIKNIIDNIPLIKEKWHDMPDLRFSQILIRLNFIPNSFGFWYYYEEDDILKLQGYKPRDYKFWGNIYNKDGELLPETNYILVKNMNIDHMQKLIDGKWLREGTEMYKVILDELINRLRKEKLLNLTKV